MSEAGTAAAAWGDAVAACTVGAERAGVPALPAGLDGLAAGAGPDGLLLAAAALAPWRLAGRLPVAAEAKLVEPMHETLPECSGAAAAQLEAILLGQGMPAPILREWCRLAAAAGVRAPPGLAMKLFNRSRAKDRFQEADPVLGARLPWLLDMTAKPLAAPGAADWSSPDLPRRAAALRLMRADPAAARDALAAVWNDEAADARAALLAGLETGLGDGDEPFLENCLDDRSVKVRAGAARLLAGLPGSRWAARMRARAEAAVHFRRGGIVSRDAMTVLLPTQDDAALRDGLDARGQAGAGAALLAQIVAAAPLSTWDGAAPDRWIKAALAGEWAQAILGGWAGATRRERSGAWAVALLAALTAMPKLKSWVGQVLQAVAPAVPPANLERAALSALQGAPQPDATLLRDCVHDWSLPFTRAILDWIAGERGTGANDYALQHATKSALDLLAVRGSVDASGRMAGVRDRLPEDAVPMLRHPFDDAAATLAFRAAMHQEFVR